MRAQESRRILDRLYGYTLSPVLWKKVQTGLSAGSRAERGRPAHRRPRGRAPGVPRRDATGISRRSCPAEGRAFAATLARVGDARVATGKDFDAEGRADRQERARCSPRPTPRASSTSLDRHLPWTVTSVEEKPGVERPAPPFTTSTLTQEASRKLGFSTERTMQAAQRLFQDGHISYHRTDSTTLSDKALAESARAIREMFGADYHAGPRRYATKVKNAQEAHEAIRPTNFTSAAGRARRRARAATICGSTS